MIRNGSLQDSSCVTLIGYQRERGFTVERGKESRRKYQKEEGCDEHMY
jgi:hypothetical protein